MGGYWIVLAGCGWLLDPFGWLWVVLVGFGSLRVVACFIIND